MSQNLKIVLVIAGVIAAYHYLFRSILPAAETVEETTGSLADELREGVDTITDQIFVGPTVANVGPRTTVVDSPDRTEQSQDANLQIYPMQRTVVLQG